jgi:hypothetical protein
MSYHRPNPHPSLSYGCPRCSAEPSQSCRTRNDRKAEWPHVQRIEIERRAAQPASRTRGRADRGGRRTGPMTTVDDLAQPCVALAQDEACEIMNEIHVDDLTACEMVALLTVLRPARERVRLAKRQPAAVLKLVPR